MCMIWVSELSVNCIEEGRMMCVWTSVITVPNKQADFARMYVISCRCCDICDMRSYGAVLVVLRGKQGSKVLLVEDVCIRGVKTNVHS